MSSKTKRIGDIGESAIITKFLKYDVDILLPFGDNAPYDLVICVNDKFYKVQVKTTEFQFDEKMTFCINRTNPFKMTSSAYEHHEVDYFALYCIETGWCGLISIEDTNNQKDISFNNSPANNQIKGVCLNKDFSFETQMKNYFGLEKCVLNDKPVHVRSYQRDEKTTPCPICGNMKKPSSKLCRKCYLEQRKNG